MVFWWDCSGVIVLPKRPLTREYPKHPLEMFPAGFWPLGGSAGSPTWTEDKVGTSHRLTPHKICTAKSSVQCGKNLAENGLIRIDLLLSFSQHILNIPMGSQFFQTIGLLDTFN